MGALSEAYRVQLTAVLVDCQTCLTRCLEEAKSAGEIAGSADCARWSSLFLIGWEGAVLRVKLGRKAAPLRGFAELFQQSVRAKLSFFALDEPVGLISMPSYFRSGEEQSKAQPTFDCVVVGAGTAGCLLADSLSAGGSRRVLPIEAGGPGNYPWIHIPVGYLYCIDNRRTDGRYRTEASPGLDGRPLVYPGGRHWADLQASTA